MRVRQRRPRNVGSVIERPRKDGTTAYMLKWQRYTETTKATSKAEAMKLLPTFVAKAQSGELDRQREERAAHDTEQTLAAWCDYYLNYVRDQDPDKLGTRATYQAMLKSCVLPDLGTFKLSDLTAADIRKTLKRASEGRKPATIKLAYAALKGALDAAVDDDLMAANPMPRLAKIVPKQARQQAGNAKRRALTPGELSGFIAECEADPIFRLYASLMAATGIRPGEAGGLLWSDVDLEQGVINVQHAIKTAKNLAGGGTVTWIGRPKTDHGVRSLRIGPVLCDLLKAERQRQEASQRAIRGLGEGVRSLGSLLAADAVVFPREPAVPSADPTPLRTWRDRFERVVGKAGLGDKDVTPHWLRHTYISHALGSGRPLANVSKDAGHANPYVTATVYAHAIPEPDSSAWIGDGLITQSAKG